jgi:hypothetical protein
VISYINTTSKLEIATATRQFKPIFLFGYAIFEYLLLHTSLQDESTQKHKNQNAE